MPPAPLAVRLHRRAYQLAFLLLRGWWWLRRPRVRGASVVVLVDGGLLVVRSSYRPDLLLPGGGAHAGEEPRATAVREMFEETGITVAASALEPFATNQFTEFHRQITTDFFRWRPPIRPEPIADGREIVWAGYVPLEVLQEQEAEGALARILPTIVSRLAAEPRADA